ncbi:hypothetical protein N7535_006771 [Penicillium sp. DV-2018c]|nr:hypothetical protein N7461_007146 [Penicillium sp. DV-2018c]KAJ5567465.1 hypothetical protein N7535_006771 [Penicillium sp. DV-2018c]
MAYNAVAQIDHEVASNSSASASRSPSPAHGHAFEQLPLDTDHIGGGSHLEPAQTTGNSTLGRLGSMIRSIPSTNYDVVEEDDDYDADPIPEEQSNSHQIPPLNTTVSRHSSPEPPLHSACSDVPVPLSHPTPDLQSIQGAYKGNVTRLEESAEQLSLCSTDIESEIRRIDQEQKRRSVSSVSNSIGHRNGAFSPAVTVSSAHASNVSPGRQRSVSGARLPYVPEPAHEGDESPGLPDLPPSRPLFDAQHDYYYDQYNSQGVPAEVALERRASVASNDTYQQARTLFTDFDGVHYTPREGIAPGRQVSLNQPPLARQPQHHQQPREGENMVFYPAPVPRMLNLPPKLSQRSNTDRDRRRTQLAGAIAEKRTSALPRSDEANPRNDKRKSTVPAHLRASVFFDQPSTPLHVEARQDSAVTTLDSILDASANAPVSAFTDHPYAGHVGSYIYNKSKRKTLTKDSTAQKTDRFSRVFMGQHNTDNVGENDGPFRSRHEIEAGENAGLVHDEHVHGPGHGSSDGTDTESAGSSEDEEDSEEGELDYVGPPNTLIAELELRKIELKHRRRTAVSVPFHGMQSTLLEMDEIAQKQSDKRRQRPVALAWEERDEDEDVPLAMLYPEKVSAGDDDRPAGLLEKQQQEENEPLSSRRARLRGEPIPKPAPRPVTMYTVQPSVHVPDVAAESDDETEVETLAQRVARLKGHTRSESQFAAELMAEIDTRAGITSTSAQEAPETNEEETLAQRRSRLQKEAAAQPGPVKNPRVRRSMATFTQGRPAQLSRQSSHDVFGQRPVTMSQYGNRMSMQQFPPQMGYGMATGYPIAQQYGYPAGYPSSYANNPAMGGMTGAGYASNMPRPTGPLSTDVIDRWRQSIR